MGQIIYKEYIVFWAKIFPVVWPSARGQNLSAAGPVTSACEGAEPISSWPRDFGLRGGRTYQQLAL